MNAALCITAKSETRLPECVNVYRNRMFAEGPFSAALPISTARLGLCHAEENFAGLDLGHCLPLVPK